MSYRRKSAPTAINSQMKEMLTSLDKHQKGGLAPLWQSWNKILGNEMSRLIKPLGSNGKTIVLGAADNIVMQEATFLGPMIVESANNFLGFNRFDKAKFELLGSRTPLDTINQPKPETKPLTPERPSSLGKLKVKDFKIKSVQKAYSSYVEFFDKPRNKDPQKENDK